MHGTFDVEEIPRHRVIRRHSDWTLKEHEVVVSYWPDIAAIQSALPHRSRAAIQNFAGKCNLRRPLHIWTQPEDQLLRRRVRENVPRQAIAKEMRLTLNQVANRMAYTGIRYGRRPANDDEPELGWPEQVNQVQRVEQDPSTFLCPDGEPDLGFAGHGTGWREGEGADDREGDHDDREPEVDGSDLELSGESPAPIPGGGSASQFGDGWRADPNYVPPVKKPARREAAARQPAGDAERVYIWNASGVGNLPPEAMEGFVPEIRAHRLGGAPC